MPFTLAAAQEWQILIGDAEVDISVATDGWVYQRSKAELDRPVTARLEADLNAGAPVVEFPFPMNPLDPFWKKGQPVKLKIEGVTVATLVLQKFDYDYDECRADSSDAPGGQLVAVCRLSLPQSGRVEPIGDAFFAAANRDRTSPTTSRRVVPWTNAAEQYLSKANISLFDASSIPTALSVRASDGQPRTDGLSAEPPNPDPNPVMEAQAIAQSRGYWLWVRPDGNVAAAKYPMPPYDRPAIRIPRDLVAKNILERLETGDEFEPPNKVNVVGQTAAGADESDPEPLSDEEPAGDEGDNEPTEGQREPCEDGGDRTIETSAGYIKVSQPKIGNGTGSLNFVRYREEKWTMASVLFPGSSSNTLIREYLTERTVYYDRRGFPTFAIARKREPAGVASSTLYPNQTRQYYSSRIEEFWDYTAGGIWRTYRKDTYQPREIIFGNSDAGGAMAIASQIETIYVEAACGKYTEVTGTKEPRGKVRPDPANPFDTTLIRTDNPDPNELDGAPEPPYKPVAQPVRPETLIAEEERIGLNADEEEQDERTVVMRHVDSPEQASAIAKMLAQQFESRRWARSIERPLDTGTLNHLDLFALEDICKSRGIVDGLSIVQAEGQILMSYTLQLVGDLANPVPLRTTSGPVVVPPAPGVSNPLAMVPEPDITLQVGEETRIILAAQGGTQPYSFSTTALPAGLTRSGDVITGTPTTTGTTAVTVTVTDASSATANDVFSIIVTPVAPAATRSRVIIRAIGGESDTATFGEPLPAIEAIGGEADSATAGVFEPLSTGELEQQWTGEIVIPIIADVEQEWGGEVELVTPSFNLPSLRLLLDPSAGYTAPGSGDPIEYNINWLSQGGVSGSKVFNAANPYNPYLANAFAASRPGLEIGVPEIVEGEPQSGFNLQTDPTTAGSYITTTAFTVFVVFRALSMTTDPVSRGSFQGDGLVGTGVRFGVYLRDIAGTPEVVVAGVSSSVHREVFQTIALNTNYLVVGWHDGSNLRMQLNNGTIQAITMGAGSALTFQQIIVGNFASTVNSAHAYLGHTVIYNGSLSDGDRNAIRTQLNTLYSLW